MNVCKTINTNNKIESFYIICRNTNDKYQVVAIPWGRIDYREFDTKEEAFNTIASTVGKRGWKTEWTNLYYSEQK